MTLYRFVGAAKQPAIRRGDLVVMAAEVEAVLADNPVLERATVEALLDINSIGVEATVSAASDDFAVLLAYAAADEAFMYALRAVSCDERRRYGTLHG